MWNTSLFSRKPKSSNTVGAATPASGNGARRSSGAGTTPAPTFSPAKLPSSASASELPTGSKAERKEAEPLNEVYFVRGRPFIAPTASVKREQAKRSSGVFAPASGGHRLSVDPAAHVRSSSGSAAGTGRRGSLLQLDPSAGLSPRQSEF